MRVPEASGWFPLRWGESGERSLSKASSNKGSRHGHVRFIISPPFLCVGGEEKLFDGSAASCTGEARGLLVPGTVYAFLETKAGLFGGITGLEILGSVTEQALAELEILAILGTVTGLAVFGTGLESLGIDTGLALLGTVSGLALFGMVIGLEILGIVTGLALFGTGLDNLGTVTGLAVFTSGL